MVGILARPGRGAGPRPLDPAPAYGDRSGRRRRCRGPDRADGGSRHPHGRHEATSLPRSRRRRRPPRPRPTTATSRLRACSTSPTCRPVPRPRMEYVYDGTVLHQFDGSTVDIPTQYPDQLLRRRWPTARTSGSPPQRHPIRRGPGRQRHLARPGPERMGPPRQQQPHSRRVGSPGRPGDGVERRCDGAARVPGPDHGRQRRHADGSRSWATTAATPMTPARSTSTSRTSRPRTVAAVGRHGERHRATARRRLPHPRRRHRGRSGHRVPQHHRLRLLLDPARRRRVPGLRDLQAHAGVVLARRNRADPRRPGVPRRHRQRRDRDVRPQGQAVVRPHSTAKAQRSTRARSGRTPPTCSRRSSRTAVVDRPVRVRRLDGVRRGPRSRASDVTENPYVLADRRAGPGD